MIRYLLACAISIGVVLSGTLDASGAGPDGAPPWRVAVAPFEIISTSNAPLLPERGKQLGRIAAERAARLLRRRRPGLEIRILDSGETQMSATDSVLTGSVRLPAPLPPGRGGAPAAFRKEVFAEATVRLQRPGARPEEVRASLQWREVRWTHGARPARLRPTEEVLEDAVRKVVDRAVERLGSTRAP